MTLNAAFVLFAASLPAATLPVTLTSGALPSQPAGTATIWTAAAAGSSSAQYQFSVASSSGNAIVLRSFHSSNTFEWAPMDEGSYQVIATVRDGAGNTGEARANFTVASRLAADGSATVSATNNPLVSIYSAPACQAGTMQATFYPTDRSLSPQYSAAKSCSGASMNFLIAGVLPETQYRVRTLWTAPDQTHQTGPETVFQTGSPDASVQIPALSATDPPDGRADASRSILLTSFIAVLDTQSAAPIATGLNGQLLWYYNRSDQPLKYLMRPVSGGAMFVLPKDDTLLREIDLAGNTVRETNIGWISEQLQSRFGFPPATSFHHDAIRLPDGSIAAIVSLEKLYIGVQGTSSFVDILGDGVVVMDANFNVTWAWNGFDKLDVRRAATLGDTCAGSNPGCPPVLLASSIHAVAANDWMHTNALDYLPDGNLLVSVRAQDWILKIDYRDGAGSGAILWKLGKDGDFKMNSTEPLPWFSHQHSAVFDGNLLWLFDNGNVRRAADSNAHSRGQVLRIDEAGRGVSLVLNADLGDYSPALGSASRLDNGDFHFLSGYIGNSRSESIEVTADPAPSGAIDYLFDAINPAYRSFRMKSLSDF